MEQTLFVGIVVHDPLVSHDISGIFAFWRAGSVCRGFDTLQQIRQLPEETSFDPGLVFIAAQDGVLNLDPDDMLWLEQRAVITLDLQDRAQFAQWRHLTRPFTQEQVIQAAYDLIEEGCADRSQAG
ncbi:MAG: hypothetical protein AAGA94_13460 [Pseudomonadota bacterium]